jgi:hypothetical protein
MYCSGGITRLKKGLNDDLDNVIFDFRERLKVKKDPQTLSSQQQSLCEDTQGVVTKQEITETPLNTFMCPTCDPFRTSQSYDKVMELIGQGNLIKEAVRLIKNARRSKQLKRLAPSR